MMRQSLLARGEGRTCGRESVRGAGADTKHYSTPKFQRRCAHPSPRAAVAPPPPHPDEGGGAGVGWGPQKAPSPGLGWGSAVL